ncbi:hypothetical protein OENI_10087 [Oenococcus oeni]|nr:hypothetical protein OENI_10087 [Oenococcus oeni]SYW07231.1 hypothetical protein OENI_10067 [Oenococcus oeni]
MNQVSIIYINFRIYPDINILIKNATDARKILLLQFIKNHKQKFNKNT